MCNVTYRLKFKKILFCCSHGCVIDHNSETINTVVIYEY